MIRASLIRMARKLHKTAQQVESWMSAFPVGAVFEYTAKDGAGTVSDADWAPLGRGFEEIKPGVRYLIRRVGESVKCAIAVLLIPPAPEVEIEDREPVERDDSLDRIVTPQDIRKLVSDIRRKEGELEARERKLLEQQRLFSVEREEGIMGSLRIARATVDIAASSVKSTAELSKELRETEESYSAVLSEIAELKGKSEMLRQGGYSLNRVIDLVEMWAIKKSGQVPPQLIAMMEKMKANERRYQALEDLGERRELYDELTLACAGLTGEQMVAMNKLTNVCMHLNGEQITDLTNQVIKQMSK